MEDSSSVSSGDFQLVNSGRTETERNGGQLRVKLKRKSPARDCGNKPTQQVDKSSQQKSCTCKSSKGRPAARRRESDGKGVRLVSAGTLTEPEYFGACEPGTQVNLGAEVWLESDCGVLSVSVSWRGRSYVGALLDTSKLGWAPPRLGQPNVEEPGRSARGGRKRRAAQSPFCGALPVRRTCASARKSTRASGSALSSTLTEASQDDSHSQHSFGSSGSAPDEAAQESPHDDDFQFACAQPGCLRRYRSAAALKHHYTHAHSHSDSLRASSQSQSCAQTACTALTEPQTQTQTHERALLPGALQRNSQRPTTTTTTHNASSKATVQLGNNHAPLHSHNANASAHKAADENSKLALKSGSGSGSSPSQAQSKQQQQQQQQHGCSKKHDKRAGKSAKRRKRDSDSSCNDGPSGKPAVDSVHSPAYSDISDTPEPVNVLASSPSSSSAHAAYFVPAGANASNPPQLFSAASRASSAAPFAAKQPKASAIVPPLCKVADGRSDSPCSAPAPAPARKAERDDRNSPSLLKPARDDGALRPLAASAPAEPAASGFGVGVGVGPAFLHTGPALPLGFVAPPNGAAANGNPVTAALMQLTAPAFSASAIDKDVLTALVNANLSANLASQSSASGNTMQLLEQYPSVFGSPVPGFMLPK